MYSWEIEQLLKLKNYLLQCEEYNHIVTTSPQINKVEYEHNDFTVETNDDYKFKFKVYAKDTRLISSVFFLCKVH